MSVHSASSARLPLVSSRNHSGETATHSTAPKALTDRTSPVPIRKLKHTFATICPSAYTRMNCPIGWNSMWLQSLVKSPLTRSAKNVITYGSTINRTRTVYPTDANVCLKVTSPEPRCGMPCARSTPPRAVYAPADAARVLMIPPKYGSQACLVYRLNFYTMPSRH